MGERHPGSVDVSGHAGVLGHAEAGQCAFSGSRVVDERAGADVDDRRRHGARPVGGGKRGRVAHVLERRGPDRAASALDHLDDRLAALARLVERLVRPSAREDDDPHSVRSSSAASWRRIVSIGSNATWVPRSSVVAHRPAAVAGTAEGGEHARAPGDHVAGGRPRGQERRSRGRLRRRDEVVDRHLGERGSVGVRVRDQVEGDVDSAGLRRDRVGMPEDRLLVERVDLRGLGRSSPLRGSPPRPPRA